MQAQSSKTGFGGRMNGVKKYKLLARPQFQASFCTWEMLIYSCCYCTRILHVCCIRYAVSALAIQLCTTYMYYTLT